MYDVDAKRCNKVFKICKKYLNHYQKSVFRGDITPSKLIKLKNEISKIIDKRTDVVSIIKLISSKSFCEEEIGLKQDPLEEIFM